MNRDLIAGLVGDWSGTYRLWLEPDRLRTEGPTRCTGRPVLGDRFVALDYEWTDLDGPQQGSMLLGCTDEGAWQLAWVDTWHTGTSILFSTGQPDTGADVLCSYGPAAEPWGWRTHFDLVSPDELVVTAWNITPAGEEEKATEAAYRRSKAPPPDVLQLTHMDLVPVRELQQHASGLLRRVRAGETLGITHRGTLVAVLSPPTGLRGAAAMVAAGRVRAATIDVEQLPAPRPADRTVADVLDELRADR